MASVADQLQRWIVTPGHDPERLAGALAHSDRVDQSEGSGHLVLAQVLLAKRFAKGLGGFEAGGASALDLAVLLRQIVRSFNRRFWIPADIWSRIEILDRRAGLFETGRDGDLVEVSTNAWQPDWLIGTERIDLLEMRRTYRSAPGSGALFAAYGHVAYQSDAQKVAVEACQFAPPGSTTLVTLPTGGGKSLCALLPAWIRSHGGDRQGGTTIVILPTVALALDQLAAARRYFADARGPAYEPRCWRGSTDAQERAEIKDALENGTIPLLFTSPESLMFPELRRAVSTAAKRSNLAQIVIDEAHIVETWGAQFRAEFQLMGAFLHELAAASGAKLRITLLSATVDQHSEELLKRLFALGEFSVVRANAIRAEPSWWFSWGGDEHDRQRKVIEALSYLPRPAILYVTSPGDADAWAETLRGHGYRRVESFSGRTTDDRRGTLLDRWRDDELDIMVATSAFGLGVDKPDVRTVVHACLPETVDRFYQEVGRGGRDGASCVSLICAIESDLDTAVGLTSASVISTQYAVNRWGGMHRTAQTLERSDLIAVSVDAPPMHDLDMHQGHRNREWNMHTLLLLQRAGLLRITHTVLPDAPGDEATQSQKPDIRLALQPYDVAAIQGTDTHLFEILDPWRTKERQRVRQNALAMKALVLSNSGTGVATAECMARQLAPLYPDCALACGGCPACRRAKRPPYADPLDLFVERHGPTAPQPAPLLDGEFAASIGARARLTISKPDQPSRVVELVAALVDVGVVQIVAADSWLEHGTVKQDLMRALADHPFAPHLIVPARWLETRQDIDLRNVPTAVIYPGSDSAADILYRQVHARWRRLPASTPLLSVIEEGTYLASESGLFVDRVPGIRETTDDILRRLRNRTQEWF